MRGDTQLTFEERSQMYILQRARHGPTAIAKLLGRHQSTMSRELQPKRGRKGYRPKQAHDRAVTRRLEKARPRIARAAWTQIEALIRQQWSPEQIAGRLDRAPGVAISHEWIYQHIYADQCSGGDLYRWLRCQKSRRKRYGTHSRRGLMPNHVSIDERPAIVATKQRLGDWEGDTVIGHGHRGARVTLVERKTLFTVIQKVYRKTAELVCQAVSQALAPYKNQVQTITYDKGREFADYAGLAKDLDAKIYFAHPYASWERGFNENTNGLLRQYFPKNRDLTTVTAPEIDHAINPLNHCPRKTLDFKTP